MIFADGWADQVAFGGGAAGILAFVLAIYKVYSQDRIWKSLIGEVRSELDDCRSARLEDHRRIGDLENEVTTLRRELHADRWLGVDSATRSLAEPEENP